MVFIAYSTRVKSKSFGVFLFWPNREYMTGKAIRSESFHYCSIEESIKDPLNGGM